MKSCLLCGGKSWGPLNSPDGLRSVLERLDAQMGDPTHFMVCDVCGTIAAKVYLEDTPQRFEDPRIMPDPFGAGLEQVSRLFKDTTTGKPDRTERLFAEVLASQTVPLVDNDPYRFAKAVATLVAALEKELGAAHPAEPAHPFARWIDSQPRNFVTDFLVPACAPFPVGTVGRQQIGLALDCAIAFGALEAQTGNKSLALSNELEQKYWQNVQRLKAMVSDS